MLVGSAAEFWAGTKGDLKGIFSQNPGGTLNKFCLPGGDLAPFRGLRQLGGIYCGVRFLIHHNDRLTIGKPGPQIIFVQGPNIPQALG